ncbi:MAG: Dam family site-specific DNA-(adenine-N6)-methyltransferase [Gammaproteobacteria bacterium]|nr:Dam family site-specific DNA-(adenine-N6)-methyltransferase [Gammaproteobacteria bacterium]
MVKPPTSGIRPFLKWAGNKYRIMHQVERMLPEGKRLVEPFVGSGAVFLNTEFEDYLLCDSNRDLIDLFNLLKRRGRKFIQECELFFKDKNNNEAQYYKFRERFNTIDDRQERAALFVYLNRHGYNGLCRYNSKGGYNVPFGRYKRPYYPTTELELFRKKTRQASFKHLPFEKAFTQLRTGDVVYCDPPYLPLEQSSNFTSYSAGGFSMEQQHTLVELAVQHSQDGIPVLISNHHTPFTDKYYDPQAKKREIFHVQRYISRDGKNRNKAGEVLALFCMD